MLNESGETRRPRLVAVLMEVYLVLIVKYDVICRNFEDVLYQV